MKYYFAALSSLSLFVIDYSTTVVPVDCLSIIDHFKCTHIHRSFLFRPRTSSYINSICNYHEHGIASISFVASISIIILHILDGWLHRLPYAVCIRGCRKKTYSATQIPTSTDIWPYCCLFSNNFTDFYICCSYICCIYIYIYIYICRHVYTFIYVLS